MSTTSPINGLPIPDEDSPNDPPIHFQAFSDVLDTRINARFTSTATRDTAIPSPVNGMSCWTDDAGYWDRIGGQWKLRPQGDTSWVSLTPSSGWTAVTASGDPGLRYRVLGRVVYLSLRMSHGTSWAAGSQLFILPAGARPGTTWYARVTKDATDGVTGGQMKILSTGVTTLNIGGDAGTSIYASTSFPVDS